MTKKTKTYNQMSDAGKQKFYDYQKEYISNNYKSYLFRLRKDKDEKYINFLASYNGSIADFVKYAIDKELQNPMADDIKYMKYLSEYDGTVSQFIRDAIDMDLKKRKQ